MTQDEFFQLGEGDTVRFKNYVQGGYNYYQVHSITRKITHELGIPMPAFGVWLVPLDANMKANLTTFRREIQAANDDARRMELVTV